jgi:high-affinity Fe2+/Pb2+ permease
MLQAFVITLREGLEAFLIVAISLAICASRAAPS